MTTRAELRAEKPRRPLLRSFRFWVPMGILLLLLAFAFVGVLIGKPIYDRAMSAKSSLEQAMPLATTAKDQILAGDSEGAKVTAAKLASLTADARKQTDDGTWKSLEWLPFAGPNLHAVRTAAAVTDDLVIGAVTPATALSLNALTPVNGAINLDAITGMQSTVTQASAAVDKAATDLESIDHDALIPQVASALTTLTGAIDELKPLLGPASEIVGILPRALGSEGPRNYLMVFQNNAESRGTGGNPAALVMINVNDGRITLGQQASSTEFNNARAEPIMPLNPETEALYGDKIGRWISDATLTPDFTETAAIIRAWWAEQFGTPIDAVVSFDPVALSYLLRATGPTEIPADPVDVNGQLVSFLDAPVTLTSENAVPMLLNQVYWWFPQGGLPQDAFFAAAATSIFNAISTGNADPKSLVDSLALAVSEGRLLYQPAAEDEAALVDASRLSGKLPGSNEDATVLGVYVNDFTAGKLDYYAQLDVSASQSQCTDRGALAHRVEATLVNTLKPDLAATLPYYISPALHFPKGHIATNLVVYGPVGATASTVTLDGEAAVAKVVNHLGRPAVNVAIQNAPGESHTVVVNFQNADGTFGPVDVRHTPMVRPTPVTIASACEPN
ncbi:DUF4012 domain-containing protein [Microbacterium sp.]|uniref:DUF4012 domain-containing protein n=1 Tax=Microbacterium sp. TaxID=51671 RepID=UPI002C50233A|nr:DUF4012 domain-containing protein [Microbacterium sp.]HWK76534.1 DUF4012 domain-containing protein [Microbacterium sp.]